LITSQDVCLFNANNINSYNLAIIIIICIVGNTDTGRNAKRNMKFLSEFEILAWMSKKEKKNLLGCDTI
jgi:hypothetical protein